MPPSEENLKKSHQKLKDVSSAKQASNNKIQSIPKVFFENNQNYAQCNGLKLNESEFGFKDKSNGQSNNLSQSINQNSNQLMPRYSQIQRSIETFKQIIPEIFNDKLIDYLYEKILAKYSGKLQNFDPQLFDIHANQSKGQEESKNQSSISKKSISKQAEPLYQQDKYTFDELNEQDIYCMVLESSGPQVEIEKPSGKTEYKLQEIEEQIQDNNQSLQDRNLRISQIIARVFCNKAYGIQALQADLQERGEQLNIDKLFYEALMKTIFLESILNLQRFLTKNCNVKICSLLKTYEQGDLFNVLANFRINFNGEVCQTLINLVKGICHLGEDVSVNSYEAARLHKAIQTKLTQQKEHIHKKDKKNCKSLLEEIFQKKSKKTFSQRSTPIRSKKSVPYKKAPTDRAQQIYELNRVWNSTYEAKFIQVYRTTFKSLADIRDVFKSKYLQDCQLFTVAALRSKLYKLLRQAVHKLYEYIGRNGSQRLPKLMKLDDIRVKLILHGQSSREVRNILLDVYSTQYYNEELVRKAIYSITNYINKCESQQLAKGGNPKIQIPYDDQGLDQLENSKVHRK